MAENDLGEYYTIPVILSFEGIDKQVNSSLGGVLGKAGKKGGLDFGKNLSEGIKASEADVKRALDNHAKLADKAADATDKLKVAQAGYDDLVKKGVTEGQRYERAKAAVAKATRDETRAINAAKNALKDYENAAKSAQGAGEKAGSGFLSGLRGAASGAGSAGSEAASSFAEGFAGSSALMGLASKGGPVGAALAAAGLVGGGLLVKNVLAGIEREPARDLVQAQLGLDEASMAKLSQSAAKAYTENFGSSIQENLSTAKSALQTGLISNADDPNTQKVIENLTAVSQILGEEIPATARSAGQLIKTGLADNASAAFDLIVKGEQAGLNISDDWLDTLNEYGTQFRKLGLSGPEAVGLISQALKGGARDSDVAADAIKEFSIRAVDGSKTTMEAYRDLGFSAKDMSERFAEGGPVAREAFGEILNAIGAIKDPLKQSQIAVSLFGTQAEDLGGALNEMDLSNAVNQLGQVDGAAQNAADTMGDNVAGSFEEGKRSIEVSVQAVQDKLAEAFGPKLKEVADWVKEHEGQIAGAFIDLGVVAISAIQDVVKSTGQFVVAVGQLAGGIGNIQGAVTKFQAWQADIRGDHETAAQLREEAEGYFAWGEGLQKVGNDMVTTANKMDGWKDSLRELERGAGEAKDGTKGLGDELNNLPNRKDIAINVTDGQGNPIPPGIVGAPPASGGGAPLLGGVFAVPGSGTPVGPSALPPGLPSGVGGVGPGGRPTPGSSFIPSGSYGLAKGTDTGGYGSSGAVFPAWVHQLEQQFGIKASTYAGHQESDRHEAGYAPNPGHENRGIDWSGPVDAMQRFADYLAQVPGALEQVIWQNPNTGRAIEIAGGRAQPGYFAADLGGHQNHVHTRQSAPIPLPSGSTAANTSRFSADWDAVARKESSGNWSTNTGNGFFGGLQFTQSTWEQYGGKEFAERADMATPDQQKVVANRVLNGWNNVPGQGPGAWPNTFTPGLNQSGPISPNMVNAFGAGYEPGIGTPGYNESGEPGYYEADPRSIANAQRRVEDTQQAIIDADERVLEAKQKRAELEDEINVTAEDRLKADRAIADAEQDARRAREDAQWAQEDAAEARKGKFTAAKEAKKQQGQAGGMSLGDLGSIAGSFLKETFGVDGSFLPDLSNIMPIQMLGAGLNAFAGPIQGLIDGKLGIQQPGWQPGMPVEGLSTGGGAFGMPDVVPPPMPADGAHPGTGAPPGPPTVINNNVSTNVQGNVGMDPVAFRKEQQRAQDRGVARLSSFGAGLR